MISSNIKSEAYSLRENGHSLSEISNILRISKSTASLLLRDIQLNTKTKLILKNKSDIAREKAILTNKNKREKVLQEIDVRASTIVSNAEIDSEQFLKVVCALLYWGEGGKTDNYVSFINSDPKMISCFLYAFRRSFHVDERKFRGLVHLHEYHKEDQIRKYWSNITKIPESLFTKSFKKKNSGINKRKNYKGTFKIKYFDYKIALELKAIYNSLFLKIGV